MASTELHQRGFSGVGRIDAPDRLADAGQVAAGLAHDIANAVTVIRLYADLLVDDPGLDAMVREHLRAIRSEADEASALAWQMLDVANRVPPDLSEVDVAAFLAEFVAVARRLLPASAGVRLECDDDDLAVVADRTRLHQILANLTGNARQALHGRGEIVFGAARIAVRAGEEPPVAGMVPGGWVRVQVADTGRGIAPDVLPRVFEPFFSTKPAGHGTGLGLSQVQALIEDHDGHVQIASVVGAGTTVTLWFPAAVRAAGGETEGTWTVQRGQGECVLVVEPDPDVRAVLARVLVRLGYRSVAVADGEDAFDELDRAGDVRAVIADVAMAGLGGEGLARRLAEREAALPVILAGRASGSLPSPTTVIRLRKPFSSRQVAAALRAVLRPA